MPEKEPKLELKLSMIWVYPMEMIKLPSKKPDPEKMKPYF